MRSNALFRPHHLSSLDYRFANTDVDVANNILVRITRRDDASGTLESNIEDAAAGLFVDGANGDLHLASGADAAIDQGVALSDVTDDIDGDPRPAGDGPDIGADERSP